MTNTLENFKNQVLQKLPSSQHELVQQMSYDELITLHNMLEEYTKDGQSTTFNNLKTLDWKHIPVSPEQFLLDEYYVGKTGKSLYPILRDHFLEIFSREDIVEVILTGCFTIDTPVITPCGSFTMEQLIKNESPYVEDWIHVLSYDTKQKKAVVKKATKPFLTRVNAKLCTVILDDNQTFRCTLDHKFMLRDGTYKEAQYLTSKDSLMPIRMNPNSRYLDVKAGFNAGSKYNPVHRLVMEEVLGRPIDSTKDWIHHKDQIRTNNYVGNLEVIKEAKHREIHAKDTKKLTQNLPYYIPKEDFSNILIKAPSYRAAENIYRLGATVMNHVSEKHYVDLQPTLVWNRVVLYNTVPFSTLGYLSLQDTEHSIRLMRSKTLTQFHKYFPEVDISTVKEYKIIYLQGYDNNYDSDTAYKKLYTDLGVEIKSWNHKVKAVIIQGTEDVYDITVPGTHNFAIGRRKDAFREGGDALSSRYDGIFVHNSIGWG